MRFSTYFLTALAAASTAAAISADDITSSLNNIETASKDATQKLKDLVNNPSTDPEIALASSHHLRDLYNTLALAVFTDPNITDSQAGHAKITAVGEAARNAGTAVTPYGIALANAAIGPLKDAGKFREACDDGINIGVVLIAMFTNLGVRYPSLAASLAPAAVTYFARVPLNQPLAATCLTPGGLPPA